MISESLPDFRLEVHFGRWEFTARHNLAASDAETMTVAELLALAGRDPAELAGLRLGYAPVEGGAELRAAIAATYQTLEPDDVLCFAGAEEAIFWLAQLAVGRGDHAVVTVPNYQSMESVTVATGAEVSGLPLWTGAGSELRWALDLDRLHALLRPTTRLVAVNFPTNPTGFVPPPEDFAELVRSCGDRGIRVLSDEVYRGVERDPARTLPQAADLSPVAVSVGVMSKAYGLPGLRVGWVATRDRDLLARLARAKHYTSICNAVPSEYLAAVALGCGEHLLARTRATLAANRDVLGAWFAERADRFAWSPPDGGCVAFPRYTGAEGVEAFCQRAVADAGVLLLPASLFTSTLDEVPADRFRVGLGRRDLAAGLAALEPVL